MRLCFCLKSRQRERFTAEALEISHCGSRVLVVMGPNGHTTKLQSARPSGEAHRRFASCGQLGVKINRPFRKCGCCPTAQRPSRTCLLRSARLHKDKMETGKGRGEESSGRGNGAVLLIVPSSSPVTAAPSREAHLAATSQASPMWLRPHHEKPIGHLSPPVFCTFSAMCVMV
jgi:hypothetical protein